MPKLSALRWPIGIFAALLLAASGAATLLQGKKVLSTAFSVLDGGGRDGVQQELQFLLATVRRIEAELPARDDGPAAPSLRGEREAVLQRLREVAGRMPAATLPADVRALLEPPPAANSADPAAPPIEPPAASARPVGELKVGLGPPIAAPADLPGLAFIAPPLVFGKRPAPRAEHVEPSAADDRAAKPRSGDHQ